jgi:hypothetical protein
VQVQLLTPDVAPVAAATGPAGHGLGLDVPASSRGSGNAFARLVDAAGSILDGADRAEQAFVAHRGGLQEMVVERARADIALAVASSAAQRATQAISSVLGMQI